MKSERAKRCIGALNRLLVPFLNLAFLRFVGAGIVNTGVDWSTFYALAGAGHLNQTAAKSISVFLGMTSAYILNALWVFRPSFMARFALQEGRRRRLALVAATYVQTLLAYALGMALNVGTFAAVRALGFFDLGSLAAATAVSFLFNYLFSRKIFGGLMRFGANGGQS